MRCEIVRLKEGDERSEILWVEIGMVEKDREDERAKTVRKQRTMLQWRAVGSLWWFRNTDNGFAEWGLGIEDANDMRDNFVGQVEQLEAPALLGGHSVRSRDT